MNKNFLNFNNLLGFSALFIAGCAAFFSIWGIGLLFSGASIAAMVMASSLELGKLVATSFLYRFWKKSQFLLKSYLCIAVIVLMGITSLGVFGYLTSAYQQSSIQYTMMQEQVTSLENQKKLSLVKIDDVKKRIESLTSLRKSQEDRLSQVNTNSMLARNPIQFRQVQEQTMELIDHTDKNIKSENDKSQSYSTDIDNVDKKITELKLTSSSAKDIQTFKFVAESAGVSINTVAKWFILILICVFDPLAVALILAYNVAINREYAIYATAPESIPQPKPEPVIQPKADVVEEKEIITEPSNNISESGVLEPKITVTSEESDPTKKSGQDDFFKRYFAHR